MCARTFLVVCQMAGPMGTNLGTWIHLDLGSVLVKSRSRGWRRHRHREGQLWSKCHKHKNGGAVCANLIHPEDGYYG